MAKRPFLVLPDHTCVPLEGPYRVERHACNWYVLGQHEVHACSSAANAAAACTQLTRQLPAHRLAEQALAGLPCDYEVPGSSA
jgi:hypothetical protein